MILTRIQIENYKQYTGTHDIAVPAQATIGVIGENGAGKTTLFEAIEWCLYSPRAIAASDVRPRSATGPTTVQVHIESVDGSQRYIVERVLKRTPSATLYRVDESGEIETVVQGPRQVTDYVAARLIGLSHTAFTATFFTRQKELHLFGDQTPGKRREEVGRLLGLETIRTAQRQFTQERSRAASDARAMSAQYDRESQGRDFASELTAADAIITQSTSQLATSAEAMTTARAALEQADAALATAQERREADSGLAQRIGSLDQERTGLLERQVQVAADLNRIVERGKERDRLAPIAARIPELSAEIKAQDHERDRFQRANELERTLSEIERRRRDLNGNVRATVDGIDKSHSQSGWVWSADDMSNPVDGMQRLIGIIDATDVTAVKSYETALRAASAAAQQCADAESILRRYTGERDKIEREEQSLLAGGEPAERLPKLDKEREELLAAQTTCLAQRTANEADRDATLALIGNLANRHFGDDCPTCGRPFSESDASIVLASLRQREEGMAAITAELIAQAADIGRQIDDNSKRRQAVHVQMEKLEHVRQRIQKSQGFLDRQVESVEHATTALTAALATAGLQSAPNANDIEVAEAAVRHANSLHNARHSLGSSLKIFLNLHNEQVATIEGRRSLGDVSFDQAAYQQLLGALQEADRAQVSITQIEHVLARTPELEAARDATAARLAVIDDSLATARAERTVLGYDSSELVNAQAARQQALAAERSASDTWHRSGSDLRQAELRRESVAKEQERLAQLARDADAKHSEAGYLEMMAKEMTEFERFAAARKVPVLGEYTSALVRSITDGRYERVEFDQDFGIVVYDGEDSESSYAVDTFSGGERDAITLAARIALSQMIGRQAVHPPGFLVLDEVFGSLDSDRRAHLLDLLGSISATFDELRQVFIISHVDDVRTSPVLDELWRVEESEDGISQILNLRPGADIDSI